MRRAALLQRVRGEARMGQDCREQPQIG